jgi:hypothetical protein
MLYTFADPSPDVATSCGIKESACGVLPKETRYRVQDLSRLGSLLSDLVAIFGALVVAYYVRFNFLGRALPESCAGGAAPHYGRTLHSKGPNRTEGARIAYILAFQIPHVPWLAVETSTGTVRRCLEKARRDRYRVAAQGEIRRSWET